MAKSPFLHLVTILQSSEIGFKNNTQLILIICKLR